VESYEKMFADRGSAYDRAMRRFPGARSAEFAQIVARLKALPGETVADVPAGGGYLRAHLPEGVRWLGHEPCASFHGAAQGGLPLLPFPWATASVDHLVCLAGLHHQADKRGFYAEVRRVLRPGGRFVLSDVPVGSVVAGFLDEFVGAHNSTGHDGIYLDDRCADELAAVGLRVLTDEVLAFPWVFADAASLGEFCHGLFDLRTVGPAETGAAAVARLGLHDVTAGVGLRWQLRTLVATPA
jgi:SAM-dependent methyltransferase